MISDEERFSVENVGYAVCVALELGFDIIKTFWTGSEETFSKIVELGSPAKVVISGGSRCDTLCECFKMTRMGMDAGAAGITYGRNVWQNEYPEAVVRVLMAIVHEDVTVEEAMAIARLCRSSFDLKSYTQSTIWHM